MDLPLEHRLKKRAHVEVARLQDELVDLLYGIDERLVLHGGTAIWRCYKGNRFSEDLDFYGRRIDKDEIARRVGSRGLKLNKLKQTGNLLFAKVTDGSTEVRIEINFAARKSPVTAPFERTGGSFVEILTLSPEALSDEKMDAYSGRRLVRDLYDLLHLSSYATVDEKMKKKAGIFLRNLPKPLDEPNLRAVVYSGAVPTFSQMEDALRRRLL